MKPAARRPLALLACAALSLVLSACQNVTVDAPTQKDYDPADGTNAMAGQIAVRNVLLVSSGNGEAALAGTFVNGGGAQDQLVGATVDGQPAELSPAAVVLAPNAPVLLGGSNGSTAQLSGLDMTKAAPGLLVTVELTFADAPRTSFKSIVVPPTGLYEGYGPSAGPAGSGTPNPSTTPSTASSPEAVDPSATPSPTAFSTPSPTPSG